MKPISQKHSIDKQNRLVLSHWLEHSSEGILVLDKDRVVVMVNQVCSALLYAVLTVEFSIGTDLNQLLDTEDGHMLFGQALNGAYSEANAYKVRLKQGNSVFDLHVTTQVIESDLTVIIIKNQTQIQKITDQNEFYKKRIENVAYSLYLLGAPLAHKQHPASFHDANSIHHDPLSVAQSIVFESNVRTIITASTIWNDKVKFLTVNFSLGDFWHNSLKDAMVSLGMRYGIVVNISTNIDAGLKVVADKDVLVNILLVLHEWVLAIQHNTSVDFVFEFDAEISTLIYVWKFNCNAIETLYHKLSIEQYDVVMKELPLQYHGVMQAGRISMIALDKLGGETSLITSEADTQALRVKIPVQLYQGKNKALLVPDSSHRENLQLAALLPDPVLAILEPILLQAGIKVWSVDQNSNVLDYLKATPCNGLLISSTLTNHAALGADLQTLVADLGKDLAEAAPAVVILDLLPSVPFEHKFITIGCKGVINYPLSDLDLTNLVTILATQRRLVHTRSMQIVDHTILNDLTGHDESFRRELIELFVEATPQSITEIIETVNANNLLEASALIHKYKSNLKLMGLVHAAEVADSLEENYKHLTLPQDHQERFANFELLVNEGLTYYKKMLGLAE